MWWSLYTTTYDSLANIVLIVFFKLQMVPDFLDSLCDHSHSDCGLSTAISTSCDNTNTVGALVLAYCVPVVVLSHIQALTRVFHMYIFHSTGYAEQNTHTKQMVED